MIIEFDEMQIWNRLTKYAWRSSNIPTWIHKTLHVSAAQEVTALLGITRTSPLCIITFCHENNNIWPYLTLFFVLPCFFFKVHMVVFADVTVDFYLCRKNITESCKKYS